MGAYEERFWSGSQESGLPRREQRGCHYRVYLPDYLSGRKFLIEGDVAADVSDAEAAIRGFAAAAPDLNDTEGIARLLLRAEAVASSRIEGVMMGSGRLLRAEAAAQAGDEPRDSTATEILANIQAMVLAMEIATASDAISVASIQEIHRRLLGGTEADKHGGVLRTQQNWIGGNGYNPCGAAYIPPPPEAVPELLADLCGFLSSDDLPPLIQTAIAHAQFETIHPFADGNGRTGRALIHVVLRRRGLASGPIIPISLVLATWAERYVAGLEGFRFVGESTSLDAREAVNQWVALFSTAALRAVGDAAMYQERISALQQEWRTRLKSRKGSAADMLISALPGTPVITIKSAAATINRSFPATNDAVRALVAVGILHPFRLGRRNRAFEAPELIDAFTGLERQLTSPEGDTRVSPPVRPAPYPPTK